MKAFAARLARLEQEARERAARAGRTRGARVAALLAYAGTDPAVLDRRARLLDVLARINDRVGLFPPGRLEAFRRTPAP